MIKGGGVVIPDLAEPTDLAGLDGAPFTADEVRAACAAVRTACGWHIAPQITETLTVDSVGGPLLWLPTRHLVDVTAVRVWNGTTMVPLSGWKQRSWSEHGYLLHQAGFPAGPRAVEVDIVHGFAETPADILPALAATARRTVTAESAGAFSVSYASDDGRMSSVLARYALGPRP